jgi:hypothetical protein
MGRLEHLPGVERVEIGVVVSQPVGDLIEYRPEALGWRALWAPGSGANRPPETQRLGEQGGVAWSAGLRRHAVSGLKQVPGDRCWT